MRKSLSLEFNHAIKQRKEISSDQKKDEALLEKLDLYLSVSGLTEFMNSYYPEKISSNYDDLRFFIGAFLYPLQMKKS